jgi:hypothetical protein
VGDLGGGEACGEPDGAGAERLDEVAPFALVAGEHGGQAAERAGDLDPVGGQAEALEAAGGRGIAGERPVEAAGQRAGGAGQPAESLGRELFRAGVDEDAAAGGDALHRGREEERAEMPAAPEQEVGLPLLEKGRHGAGLVGRRGQERGVQARGRVGGHVGGGDEKVEALALAGHVIGQRRQRSDARGVVDMGPDERSGRAGQGGRAGRRRRGGAAAAQGAECGEREGARHGRGGQAPSSSVGEAGVSSSRRR